MDFLKKLQKLPESTRKIILWSIIIILAVVLIFFWAKGAQKILRSFKRPSFFEELKMPEQLQELKETIKELEYYGQEATTTE